MKKGHHAECFVPLTLDEVQVDQSKLEALHKRFRAFDSDSSSFIDSTELTPLLQSLGFNPTEERVREILSAFDTDDTGTLTFGEFVEVLTKNATTS